MLGNGDSKAINLSVRKINEYSAFIGMRIALNHMYDRYHLPIFISECGFGAYDQVEADMVPTVPSS